MNSLGSLVGWSLRWTRKGNSLGCCSMAFEASRIELTFVTQYHWTQPRDRIIVSSRTELSARHHPLIIGGISSTNTGIRVVSEDKNEINASGHTRAGIHQGCDFPVVSEVGTNTSTPSFILLSTAGKTASVVVTSVISFVFEGWLTFSCSHENREHA